MDYVIFIFILSLSYYSAKNREYVEQNKFTFGKGRLDILVAFIIHTFLMLEILKVLRWVFLENIFLGMIKDFEESGKQNPEIIDHLKKDKT